MAEPYIIKMPKLSDTMTEGVIVSWEKHIGDRIERGDIVASVETDKAIMDVEVFHDGYFSGPIAPVDSTVPVGEAIAYLVDSPELVQGGEAVASAAPVAETPPAPAAAESAHGADNASAKANSVGSPAGVGFEIKMPKLSDTMTEGVVVSWEKEIGEKVERGSVVASVETDKAIMDVEVFHDGYLSGPRIAVDSVVPVGAVMAYLVDEPGQVVRDETAATAIASAAGVRKEDEVARLPATPAAAIAPVTKPAAPASSQVVPPARALGQGRPMSAMEKAVSTSMTASLSMPTFHVTVNARPEALIRAAERSGLSLTVSIAKACALAMAEHPQMNWCYQPGDQLLERTTVDIGVAVSAEGGGLVAPVLRGCESRSLEELNESWKGLVERARKRRLAPEEYADPSFTVSNMGMLGVAYFDAIPSPGTAAILAIASAGPEGMPLTITADHRVINGAEVGKYLNTLKGLIEAPEAWMGSGGKAIPEGEWDYDVLVIGGGPGGEDAARELAGHGLKVAMVNAAPLPGGECLWRGCIPSKTWRAAADRLRNRVHDTLLGVEGGGEPRLNWEALEAHRREVLEGRGKMALNTDKGVKIEVIQGFARFEADHRVFVATSGNTDNPYEHDGPGNGTEGRHISFAAAIIATGAPAFVPPIPGAREGVEAGGVLTSDTVWNLTAQPKKLGIIGGGAIGVEMAQIFQDFGTEVLLLEGKDHVLAGAEPELAGLLNKILDQDPRLTIATNTRTSEVRGKPGKMVMAYEDGEGKAQAFECDYLLMATGKHPVLEPLQLNKAGVAVEKGVIKADTHCRTSVPHIFAVGDVTGKPMLAHTASRQGRVAAANLLGGNAIYEQDKDSGVIFTRPELAFVGLSLEQAKVRGIDAVEVKMPMSIDARAMISGETEGMIKLVADKASHRILGVHLLADHADTLIGEAVMMVAGNMTLEQVAEAIHPHPTQTELFGEMARRLLLRLRRSKRN